MMFAPMAGTLRLERARGCTPQCGKRDSRQSSWHTGWDGAPYCSNSPEYRVRLEGRSRTVVLHRDHLMRYQPQAETRRGSWERDEPPPPSLSPPAVAAGPVRAQRRLYQSRRRTVGRLWAGWGCCVPCLSLWVSQHALMLLCFGEIYCLGDVCIV